MRGLGCRERSGVSHLEEIITKKGAFQACFILMNPLEKRLDLEGKVTL